MTKLYLVRHGETIFNRMQKMQGWADSPLTDKGFADATRAGKRLADVPFAAVYASDMMRAIRTAKEIVHQSHTNAQADVTINPDFREVNFGSFEGLDRQATWAQVGKPHGFTSKAEILQATSPETARDWMKEADPRHAAENTTELWQRLRHGLALFEDQQAHNILLVTHGTLIRTMVAKFGDQNVAKLAVPENGSVTTMVFTPAGWQIERYNITE